MVRSEAPGSTVLVVGHSNTISPLLRSLGGWDEPPLSESEFDRMYVVVLRTPGAATLVRAAYPPR
jgi:broad specificity phosphatase PhoE